MCAGVILSASRSMSAEAFAHMLRLALSMTAQKNGIILTTCSGIEKKNGIKKPCLLKQGFSFRKCVMLRHSKHVGKGLCAHPSSASGRYPCTLHNRCLYCYISFACGERSKGTTTLKLILRPMLYIPGCTPAGTLGLSKYLSLLMFD
jgi:hypothetical protein